MQGDVRQSWESARAALALGLPRIKSPFQPDAVFDDLRSLRPLIQVRPVEMQKDTLAFVLVRRQPGHFTSQHRALDTEVQLTLNVRRISRSR